MEKDKNEDTGKAGAPIAPNPQAPAAVQRCPGSMMPALPLDIVSLLPKSVKRRVNALKQLQVQGAHLEAKFYKEVHELERKYAALYQAHFDKRYNIVTGAVEPTDEECEWHCDREDEEALPDDLSKKATVEAQQQEEAPTEEAPTEEAPTEEAPTEEAPTEEAPTEEAPTEEAPKGIPEFWLTIFKNVDMLSDMLQEHDEPILRHLQDIKVKFSDPDQPMSFTLEFHFEPNSFFKNEVLAKVYKMKSEPDPEDPFSFEGPEIVDCEGCDIDWHKGKDVTVKTIKKKQKHKGRGTVRTITKQVPSDSFFNFFNPIKVSSDGEMDEDSELILATDFEIGHFFRERIVPHAVLYFTGEALEDDESYEEEELEEGEEEQDHEEDEDDEGDDPKEEEKQAIGSSNVEVLRSLVSPAHPPPQKSANSSPTSPHPTPAANTRDQMFSDA